MDGNGKAFASALIKMAVSPVKADREAISRVERECSVSITELTDLLEESEIFYSLEKSSKSQLSLTILATGFFWAGVIGVIMLLIRPSFVWHGVGLGFIAGSAATLKKS